MPDSPRWQAPTKQIPTTLSIRSNQLDARSGPRRYLPHGFHKRFRRCRLTVLCCRRGPPSAGSEAASRRMEATSFARHKSVGPCWSERTRSGRGAGNTLLWEVELRSPESCPEDRFQRPTWVVTVLDAAPVSVPTHPPLDAFRWPTAPGAVPPARLPLHAVPRLPASAAGRDAPVPGRPTSPGDLPRDGRGGRGAASPSLD